MKTLSWNITGVGREGFIQEVKELINVYQPYFLLLMENKVNTNKAEKIIKVLTSHFPFHVQVSSIGFMGGLWVLWKDSPHFHF